MIGSRFGSVGSFILAVAALVSIVRVPETSALEAWAIKDVQPFDVQDSGVSLAQDSSGVQYILYGRVKELPIRPYPSLWLATLADGEWTSEQVDGSETNKVGARSELAVDGLGQLHALYYPTVSPFHAIYAVRDGGTWTIESVVGMNQTQSCRLAVEGSGRPHIVYGVSTYRQEGGTLDEQVFEAVKDGGVWTTERIGGPWGDFDPSVAIGADGSSHVSYYTRIQDCDFDNSYGQSGALVYAHRNGSAWTIEAVDFGPVGIKSSITVDASGRPAIRYLTWVPCYGGFDELRCATKDNGVWTVETVTQLDMPYGGEGSIAVDAAGSIHLTTYRYWGSDLLYSRRAGGVWETSVLDDEDEVGHNSSIIVAADGSPAIAYRHDKPTIYSDLRYAATESPTAVGVPPVVVGLSAFPNPTRGEGLTIEWRSEVEGGPGQLAIFDPSGRLVRNLHTGPASPAGIVRWDGRDATGRLVAPGTYFLRASSRTGVTTRTVQVVR